MMRTHSEYVVRFSNGEFKFFFAEDIDHLKEILSWYHKDKEIATIYSTLWTSEKDQWNQ
jgi:hypothetical protein